MTLPTGEAHVQGKAENARRTAQVLELYAGDLRRLQGELAQFEHQSWRSPAGRLFLERVRTMVNDLSACGEALTLAANARRQVADTPQDRAWG